LSQICWERIDTSAPAHHGAVVMRLTVNLTQENYERVKRVASLNQSSLSEALNRLLANPPQPQVKEGADGRPLVVGVEGFGPVDSHDLEAEEDLRQAELAGFQVR
jgi:hypothetical protein